MRTTVLISLLLVSSAIVAQIKEIGAKAITELKSVLSLPKLYVLDDNNKPVRVSFDDDYDETENETRVDLHNRVQFYLYTSDTASDPVKLFVDDVEGLKNSDFNPRRPTKFITHGWINSHYSQACTLIRDAYLKSGDYNIIVIDWSSITFRPYIWASNRVLMVGEYVSTMIDFLETQGMNPAQVSFVGHSLGAHVAGLSSHYAKHKLAYVIALDPALPNFSSAKPGSRVSKGDADYVQVIHSNGGFLGYVTPLGDSDFYPNGGSFQPGCVFDVGGACSHLRSYKYYAESVNNNQFVGVQCDNYEHFLSNKCENNPTAYMGGVSPDVNVEGTYYLDTNARSTFATGTRYPRNLLSLWF